MECNLEGTTSQCLQEHSLVVSDAAANHSSWSHLARTLRHCQACLLPLLLRQALSVLSLPADDANTGRAGCWLPCCAAEQRQAGLGACFLAEGCASCWGAAPKRPSIC